MFYVSALIFVLIKFMGEQVNESSALSFEGLSLRKVLLCFKGLQWISL